MMRLAMKNVLQKAGKRGALSVSFRRLSTENVVMESKAEETKTDAPDPAESESEEATSPKRVESERIAEFRKKLKEDMAAIELNRFNLMTPIENDPLPPWPNNVNPHTGEVGGPRGPEPTRYGDWERKGIAVDF